MRNKINENLTTVVDLCKYGSKSIGGSVRGG